MLNSPNTVDGDVQAHQMPVMTDAERQKSIDAISTRMRSISEEGDENLQFDYDILRFALAPLTDEPALWSYWFNDETHYQEARFGKPQLKNGKYIRETYYTTPPAQILRPVELPLAFAYTIEGMEEYIDGWWLRKDDVIEALRQQGIEVKS